MVGLHHRTFWRWECAGAPVRFVGTTGVVAFRFNLRYCRPMQSMLHTHWQKTAGWRARLCGKFTHHPEETGETYLQHLGFTLRMGARFIYTTTVLIIHGLFPFLLTRAASRQIEIIYTIMRARVPKARRDAIELDYQV